MSEARTPEKRDEWAFFELSRLRDTWVRADTPTKVAHLRAILGAIDQERVEARQRVIDAVDDCPKEGCPVCDLALALEKLEAQNSTDTTTEETETS